MNITGIRATDEFYQYNTKKQTAERGKKIRHAQKKQMADPLEDLYMAPQNEKMQKAISDLQQDDVLMQYQFFISEEK